MIESKKKIYLIIFTMDEEQSYSLIVYEEVDVRKIHRAIKA